MKIIKIVIRYLNERIPHKINNIKTKTLIINFQIH